MKQRKIYTKIWKDDWFYDLSQSARLVFIYLLTNESIGFSGCYEISDRQIIFDTKIKELDKVKKELFPKVIFYNGWVYVVNSQGYNNFVGDSFERAISKEMDLIPDNIKNTLIKVKEYPTPEVTVGYSGGTNSNNSINYNISNTSKDYMESITPEIISEIANKYSISEKIVMDKLDSIKLWEDEKPGRMKGRNWKATLMNWIRRDIENGKIKKIIVSKPIETEYQTPEEKQRALKKLDTIRNNVLNKIKLTP